MKWWHALFWWILDTAMVNAHRVYSVEEEKVGRTPMNRFDFIQSVVEELKHDGVHYDEDTVENATVWIRLPWIDARDAKTVGNGNMSNPRFSQLVEHVRATCASTA